MISKDEVIEIAMKAGLTPYFEAQLFDIERFANACYKRGIEDAISKWKELDVTFITERAIRELGETE